MKFQIIPVTPFQQNCSLLWDEQTMLGAVVDPGGDIDRILAAIESKGVTVEKILITHGHLDHAGHAADLARRLNVKIEGPHKDETFWLERLGNDKGRMFGFPPGEVFTPDHWLEDGNTATIGTKTLQVFHCPGYTPGHVVFYSLTVGLAIVGDELLRDSIGRTNFPKDNHADLINTIRKALALPDDVEFIPRYGPMSTISDEKENNPFVADRKSG